MAANYTIPGPPLDGTFGALETGTSLGTFLFGIVTLQTFNYYHQFQEDSRLLKTTITGIWLFELGHTICSLYAMYWTTVTSYGRLTDTFIVHLPRLLIVLVLFSAGIDTLVQVFFANRIRGLSGRPHVFFLCIALIAVRFICTMGLIAAIWTSDPGLLVIESKVRWVLILASSIGPVADFIIALSMCYCLWHIRESGSHFHRRVYENNGKYIACSSHSRTRTVVDTLIIWTIETTIVTSVAGVLQLILILTRTDLSFLIVYLIQPKLFSNSMLAVLNGRTRFRSAKDKIVFGPVFDSAVIGTSRREGGTLPDIIRHSSSAPNVGIQMGAIPESVDCVFPEDIICDCRPGQARC